MYDMHLNNTSFLFSRIECIFSKLKLGSATLPQWGITIKDIKGFTIHEKKLINIVHSIPNMMRF